MNKIVIVDYGLANLRSVQKAFEKVGHAAEITCRPERVAEAERLVLPGVGAFRDAIAGLHAKGLAESVIEHIDHGFPFLGICLGLQMLFTRSHEEGLYPGLDVLPGEVVRFQAKPGLKVPHMGWNTLTVNPACPLFKGLPANPAVYFVHSYYPVPLDESIIAAEAEYPDRFCCAVWRDQLFATQFHPEKSQQVGLTMLRNFAEL